MADGARRYAATLRTIVTVRGVGHGFRFFCYGDSFFCVRRRRCKKQRDEIAMIMHENIDSEDGSAKCPRPRRRLQQKEP